MSVLLGDVSPSVHGGQDRPVSIRLLSRENASDPLHRYPASELDALRAAGELLWLDVTSDDPDLVERIGSEFGFDPAAIEDIIDVEQMPKFDDYGDHLFVVLHGLSFEGDRVDTQEVDCFVAKNVFVTVHAEHVVGLDWLWDAVQQQDHLHADSADELFGHFAEVTGRRYFDVANVIEERIDALADAALDADSSVLEEIHMLRREEATVRRMLRPQLMVINDLHHRNRRVIGPAGLSLLSDAYDVHRQVVDSLLSARGLLADTLDTYRGSTAEMHARATTVLAMYSAVLLPLTVISGFYGMNVMLPGAERHGAWWIIMGAMMLIAVGSVIAFIRAGMLRLPRDRSDRLTAGLANVAKMPVKPFAIITRGRTRSPGASRTSGSSRPAGLSRPKRNGS